MSTSIINNSISACPSTGQDNRPRLLDVTKDNTGEACNHTAASPCIQAGRCVNNCVAYGRVCPRAAQIAATYAAKEIAHMKEGSAFFDSEDDSANTSSCDPASDASCRCKHGLPLLNAEDMVIGDKLGEGGYCKVNLCKLSSGNEAGQTFAVKYLKRKTMADLHHFKHGAADLALEAHFLNRLDHPHIVKLHGVTAGSVETAVASGKECGFFIVVDKLVDTLEHRIAQWHEEDEKSQEQHHFLRFSNAYRQRKQENLQYRLQIALNIAEALEYMHSLGVIFRDLKPDNIGFDENDVLKLFDFGLAKELKPSKKKANGMYQLTGNTGSRRYMAPEVARSMDYDQSVDVFSFAILLWEMCTAEKPYMGYSSGKHMNQVILGGERPKMDGSHTFYWPNGLQQLITRCWASDHHKRPSFTEIRTTLQDILDQSFSNHSSPPSPTKRTVSPNQFSLLSPLSPLRKGRGKSTGCSDELPRDVKSIKPLAKVGNRSRSWGFGHK